MDVRGVGGVNSVAEGPTAEGEVLIYVVGIDEVEGVVDVRGVDEVNDAAEGPTAEGAAVVYGVNIDEVEGVDVRDIDEVNDAAEMVEVRDGVWLVMV